MSERQFFILKPQILQTPHSGPDSELVLIVQLLVLFDTCNIQKIQRNY